jgi:hypothetical protein
MYPQWRNWLAHGTYKTVVVSDAGVVSSSLTWGTFFFATFFIVGVGGWVGVHLGSPLQPQFEDVVVAAALDHLVAGVVSDVIQFILHKQIIRRHLVAAHQQALQSNVNMRHKGDWGRLRLL